MILIHPYWLRYVDMFHETLITKTKEPNLKLQVASWITGNEQANIKAF